MGAGRTELARILFGLDSYREGTIRLDGQMLRSGDIAARLRAGVAFLTEDRRHEGLLSEASVADNLALAVLPRFARLAGGRIESRRLDEALQSMIERLHVKTGALHSTAIRTLSGGNQQKVVLGRWLLRHPALFILDEPTRGVDVGAKQEIYRALVALADAGMSILLISSDLEELTGLADRILIMYRGRLQAEISRHEFDEKAILQAVFGQRAA
jgi:ribose transport system ATP-binding protein